MGMKRTMRFALGFALVAAGAATATVLVSRAEEPVRTVVTDNAATIPIDGPFRYVVEYLGVKCGEMTLESRLEDYQGRPTYHILMSARNSKFFNKIYRVDGQIESWVDAETMSTVAYESDITERGRRRVVYYRIDREAGVIRTNKKGMPAESPYEGGPALDPMAFVYRGRTLAEKVGATFPLTLFTDHGGIETISNVGPRKQFRAFDGKRTLLRVQPVTADGEMFSRKGEFVYWIDPGPTRTLYRLDFKLSFGRLTASLRGPAEGVVDRRDPAELENPPPAETPVKKK